VARVATCTASTGRAGLCGLRALLQPDLRISEDPATGTAAGPLAGHLATHGVVADGSTVFIEQGHWIGRPSLIEVSMVAERVTIAGACVIVGDGTLHS
jgi:PhzF family phenazine biosynthesis protein